VSGKVLLDRLAGSGEGTACPQRCWTGWRGQRLVGGAEEVTGKRGVTQADPFGRPWTA
jgi:hypothetical protein